MVDDDSARPTAEREPLAPLTSCDNAVTCTNTLPENRPAGTAQRLSLSPPELLQRL